MVPRGGIEPPTQGFSEYCSTKNACKYRVCEGIEISVRKNERYKLPYRQWKYSIVEVLYHY